MDIPNLSPTNPSVPATPQNLKKALPLVLILFLSVASGFILSRLTPSTPGSSSSNPIPFTNGAVNKEDIVPGVVYGDQNKNYNDSATGLLKSGSVNGEGTHFLEREGGETQKVTLTSSSIDLDLFVDKMVEIKGQTNSSTKAGWFVDVFTIKQLQ